MRVRERATRTRTRTRTRARRACARYGAVPHGRTPRTGHGARVIDALGGDCMSERRSLQLRSLQLQSAVDRHRRAGEARWLALPSCGRSSFTDGSVSHELRVFGSSPCLCVVTWMEKAFSPRSPPTGRTVGGLSARGVACPSPSSRRDDPPSIDRDPHCLVVSSATRSAVLL